MLKKPTRIPLLLGFSLFYGAVIAQNTLSLQAQPVPKTIKMPILESLAHYDLFEMDAKALYAHAQESAQHTFELHLQFGTQADWNLVLEPAKVHGSDFEFRMQGGQRVQAATHITYKGYLKNDPTTQVRMTISDNYIFGLILDKEQQTFEMIQKSTQLSKKEVFTFYKNNSFNSEPLHCGHAFVPTTPDIQQAPLPQTASLLSTYCTRLSPVLDWQGLAKAGSLANFNADLQTIFNVVNGYYAVFSVQYELNPVFVIAASPNPWTDAPGNQSQLVQNFAGWAFPNLSPTTYNCALLFTGTNMNGIGYAYYAHMCPGDAQRFGEIDYQYTQPITQRANLTTHELGHLWGAQHSSSSSTLIMSPTIYNGTLQWDAAASTLIANNVNTTFNTCLGRCSRLAVHWTYPVQNQVFTNLNSMTFAANAVADGNVTSVSFWVNNVLMGTDNSSPYTLNWTPPAYADYTLKAIVTDNLGATLSESITITVQNGVRTTIVVPVNRSSDDAEQNISSGSVDLTSTDLELANEGGTTPQEVGMRFNTINIPKNAAITNAYIQFTTDETDSNPVALTIYGEDKANPTTFISTNLNISSRMKTSLSVPWSPAAWTVTGEAATAQRTPNLSNLVQHLVNRADWVPNNSMVFLINGASKRTASSYDYAAASAPVLHITYNPTVSGVETATFSTLYWTAFPNPFNSSVDFQFELPQASPLQITVFNGIGQRITSIADRNFGEGKHTVQWTPDATIPIGIYYVMLSTGNQVFMHKILKNL
ncbi:MAG: hypothetical protein RIS64_401 [Bacteroidota bacterium]|jgi:hypothetical protein